jgi:hypothetical protein
MPLAQSTEGFNFSDAGAKRFGRDDRSIACAERSGGESEADKDKMAG